MTRPSTANALMHRCHSGSLPLVPAERPRRVVALRGRSGCWWELGAALTFSRRNAPALTTSAPVRKRQPTTLTGRTTVCAKQIRHVPTVVPIGRQSRSWRSRRTGGPSRWRRRSMPSPPPRSRGVRRSSDLRPRRAGSPGPIRRWCRTGAVCCRWRGVRATNRSPPNVPGGPAEGVHVGDCQVVAVAVCNDRTTDRSDCGDDTGRLTATRTGDERHRLHAVLLEREHGRDLVGEVPGVLDRLKRGLDEHLALCGPGSPADPAWAVVGHLLGPVPRAGHTGRGHRATCRRWR